MHHLHERQIQYARARIWRSLDEISDRDEIREWVREVVRSVLDQTQALLQDTEPERDVIRGNGGLRHRWEGRVHAFQRMALAILAEVEESVRMLGNVEEEEKLLNQIQRAEELVVKVCGVCLDLLTIEHDLLTEDI